MIVVNLFAGPGAGKSTTAAGVFFELKSAGVNCELVREYAKRKVWEGNSTVFESQAYIFGKQSYETHYTAKSVDVIITDSPLLLSALYNTDEVLGEKFNEVVLDTFNSYNNINYYINRVKPYNPSGRHQDEEGAKAIDTKTKEMLDSYGVSYVEVDGNRAGMYDIVSDVLIALGKLSAIPLYKDSVDTNGNIVGYAVQYMDGENPTRDTIEQINSFMEED